MGIGAKASRQVKTGKARGQGVATARVKRSFHFLGAVVGGILALGPFFGMFGMMRAFRVLGQSGTSEASALSGAISNAMLGTVVGMIAWPIGAMLCAYCVVQLTKKPKQPPALPPG